MYAVVAVGDTKIMPSLMANIVERASIVVIVESLVLSKPCARIVLSVGRALFLSHLRVDRMVVDVIEGFINAHSYCKLCEEECCSERLHLFFGYLFVFCLRL